MAQVRVVVSRSRLVLADFESVVPGATTTGENANRDWTPSLHANSSNKVGKCDGLIVVAESGTLIAADLFPVDRRPFFLPCPTRQLGLFTAERFDITARDRIRDRSRSILRVYRSDGRSDAIQPSAPTVESIGATSSVRGQPDG